MRGLSFRLHMKEPMTKLENPVLMATIGGAQGLRGEVRDFYTAVPQYRVLTESGSQHNVVFSGGFVVHF